MKKVSEERPQDTFSLFLRHMSNGDCPVRICCKRFATSCVEKRKAEPLRGRPFSKMHETRLFFGFSEESV